MKIKFDMNIMKFISMFETITHASVKDCIQQDERLVFIVNQGEIMKAIGKGGRNIKQMERNVKKKVKVVEYNPDLIEFVKNVVAPLKTADVSEDDGVVKIIPPDSQTRGMLIGRGAVNLRGFEDIVKRYFPIKEIKVV
ncbi:NusA-like transcription termination signal-binding factor [Candidatus Woesearchaeota archaeon]|nr:NusA-like transcription termination signal-binding factor [Candidatus Woesearchaeota archaeon]